MSTQHGTEGVRNKMHGQVGVTPAVGDRVPLSGFHLAPKENHACSLLEQPFVRKGHPINGNQK